MSTETISEAVLVSGSVRTVVTRDTHPIAAAKVRERQPAEVADEVVDQPRLYCPETPLRPPRDEQLLEALDLPERPPAVVHDRVAAPEVQQRPDTLVRAFAFQM